MAKNKSLDEDIEPGADEETGARGPRINKKIFLIIIPVLIVIAGAISSFTFFNRPESSAGQNYTIVNKPASDSKDSKDNKNGPKTETVVFYDLPEITVQIKDTSGDHATLKIKLNMELSDPHDIKTLDAFVPRITDAVITHTVELNAEEVKGVGNLYWLKEALLKRINLVVDPIRINAINFKVFEVTKN